MADLVVQADELIVKMSGVEHLEAVHSDVHVPLSTVVGVRIVPTAWPELRGLRAPGTGLPNVIAVGTRRGGFGKDFVVVHGRGQAVVVDLEGAEYGRLVVTTEDAAVVAASIRKAAGR